MVTEAAETAAVAKVAVAKVAEKAGVKEVARAEARAGVARVAAKAGVATEEAQVEEAGCSGWGNHRSRFPNHNTTKLNLARRRRTRHPPRTTHGHRYPRRPRTCSYSRSRARAGVARVAVVTAAVTVVVLVGVVAWCTDWGSRHSQNRGDTTRLWTGGLHRHKRRLGRRRM